MEMDDIFFGRVECTEEFKTAWNRRQYKIFGIYGPKSVGKTRYAENILRILRNSDKSFTVKTLTLDFHRIKTYKDYHETVAGFFNIPDHEACSFTYCKCIQKIIKFLKGSEDDYIFHHDHQEEAKSKPDLEGNLPDSTKQTLWDQIYAEVIKPLLTECSNFHLVISSTDEFRFAQLRKTFWMQKIPALTENESMELLNDVWPSSVEDTKSCQHIVRLCDGIPPAIINEGLLMKDNVISVDEVIQLMVKQIIGVLSDEFLPHPERINTQLQHRWKQLSREQSDSLVKTLMIIKYTSQSTIAANAKLFKCNTVADYKFNHLLPLLRRNLLSYNKDDETVFSCPLIQHILDAVNYIKADKIREELREQIKAILEQQQQSGADCCTFDSKLLSFSPDSVELPKNRCTCPQNSIDNADRANSYAPQSYICQKALRENENFKASDERKCFSKFPVEHESNYSGGIQVQGPGDSESNAKSRHDSFIRQNLNRKSLEEEKHYECKDIGDTKFSLSPKHMSLESEQFLLNHEKNKHERYPSCPQENAENNFSTDDNTAALSLEHLELTPRGPVAAINSSPSTEENSPNSCTCDIDQGPYVTLSGVYSMINFENNEIPIKGPNEVSVTQPEDTVKTNIEKRIYPKSPIQVSSEKAKGVNITSWIDGFSPTPCQLNTPQLNINNDVQSKNAPSKRWEELNPTQTLTYTENMGIIIQEASSPSEETVPKSCAPSFPNNQKFKIQKDKPVSEK